MKKPAKPKIEVLIVESELGWGQRIEEVKEFTTKAKAEAFVKKYNARNTAKEVPECYTYAMIR